MSDNAIKYRKKPVVIEAVQFLGFSDDTGQVMFSERPDWLTRAFGKTILFFGLRDTLAIVTLDGDRIASTGDYIIQGVKGELYPCKPDIFDLTYEPVDSPNENERLQAEIETLKARVAEKDAIKQLLIQRADELVSERDAAHAKVAELTEECRR